MFEIFSSKTMTSLMILLILFEMIMVICGEVDVWPHPQYIISKDQFLTIDSQNFQFIEKSGEKCQLLSLAIGRAKDNAFIEECVKVGKRGQLKFGPNKQQNQISSNINNRGFLSNITIEVKRCPNFPHLDMNENYTLVVNATTKEAHIRSEVIWGAIRGLETFSQLVKSIGNNQFVLNETKILDFPRFAYRGILIDTSRHYIPVDVIYENLDAMSYNKLNVFHWHIVDDNSFPYVSKTFPNLSLNGSYDPRTHIYTPQDVQSVIEYARQRGIRVIPEFDSPGHTLSWGRGQNNILTECYTNGTKDGKYGPIDPTKDNVYTFIEQLFKEVSNTFTDSYFHLGGDEVDFKCWKSNPNINKFMKQKRIKTFSELEDYYMQKVLNIVQNLGKSCMIWEEVFNNGVKLKPDTVVHVWIGSWGTQKEKYWRSELRNVTKKGFRAILSSCWYLDLISYGSDWTQYYSCEPLSFNGTEKQNSLVIGGEATIWTEYVNAGNLISRTWPRASATAERLWSPKRFSDYKKAENRFHKQNCRLIERGIKTEPNEGPGFCRCDYVL